MTTYSLRPLSTLSTYQSQNITPPSVARFAVPPPLHRASPHHLVIPPNSAPTPSVLAIFNPITHHNTQSLLAPPLNKSNLLSLHFHAEQKLTETAITLSRIEHLKGPQFQFLMDQIHHAQALVLDAVYLIYKDMDDGLKCPKPHRSSLPSEDREALETGFREYVLFAAQALTHGFQIRGLEQNTDQLMTPALQLIAAYQAVRQVFYLRATTCPEPPYQSLYDVLIDFDQAWSQFEAILFMSYHRTKTELESLPPQFPLLVHALHKTLHKSIGKGYVQESQVECVDPDLMISLPRLTLLNCILHKKYRLVDLDRPDQCFSWFLPHLPKLIRINKLIKGFTRAQLQTLKIQLSSGESDGNSSSSSEDNSDDHLEEVQVHQVFKLLCQVADSLCYGNNAKWLVRAMETVFQGL